MTVFRSSSVPARRLRPSNAAPRSIVKAIWWTSPSTSEVDCKVTVFAQIAPETLPLTTTCWPATNPDTLPCYPTMTSAACTSPAISPSIWRMLRLIILKPWPMMRRSLPIIDLSPLSVGPVRCCCTPAAPTAVPFASGVGLRERMKKPLIQRQLPPLAAADGQNTAVPGISTSRLQAGKFKSSPQRVTLATAIPRAAAEAPRRCTQERAPALPGGIG